jgi:hypothetical protein
MRDYLAVWYALLHGDDGYVFELESNRGASHVSPALLSVEEPPAEPSATTA